MAKVRSWAGLDVHVGKTLAATMDRESWCDRVAVTEPCQTVDALAWRQRTQPSADSLVTSAISRSPASAVSRRSRNSRMSATRMRRWLPTRL